MSENILPAEESMVTIVSVLDGTISVASAHVMVAKPDAIAVKIDASVSSLPTYKPSQSLTLLYSRGERVWRLKATVSSVVDSERLTIRPVGQSKEGDRRDFRRADLPARIFVGASESSDIGEVRRQQLATEQPDELYVEQSINLSGSGVQVSVKEDYEGGTLLDVRLVLPLATPTTVCVVGQVVRMLDITTDAGRRMAVRFLEIAEPDQDLIVYTVFSRYFSDEGMSDELSLQV